MLNGKNRGAILPVVMVAIVLTQILFYTVLNVYQNQMESYILFIDHYQSQTILSLTENYLDEANNIPQQITYNLGEVTIEKLPGNSFKLQSVLSNGHLEQKIIKPPLID